MLAILTAAILSRIHFGLEESRLRSDFVLAFDSKCSNKLHHMNYAYGFGKAAHDLISHYSNHRDIYENKVFDLQTQLLSLWNRPTPTRFKSISDLLLTYTGLRPPRLFFNDLHYDHQWSSDNYIKPSTVQPIEDIVMNGITIVDRSELKEIKRAIGAENIECNIYISGDKYIALIFDPFMDREDIIVVRSKGNSDVSWKRLMFSNGNMLNVSGVGKRREFACAISNNKLCIYGSGRAAATFIEVYDLASGNRLLALSTVNWFYVK